MWKSFEEEESDPNPRTPSPPPPRHPALKSSSCGPVPRWASSVGPDWFSSFLCWGPHGPSWDVPVSAPKRRRTEGDKRAICYMFTGKGQAPPLRTREGRLCPPGHSRWGGGGTLISICSLGSPLRRDGTQPLPCLRSTHL